MSVSIPHSRSPRDLRQSLTSSEPSPRGSCSSVFSRFSQSTSRSASSPARLSLGCVGVVGSSTGAGRVLAASCKATGPNDSSFSSDSGVETWSSSTGVGGMLRFFQSGCVCSELDWISDSATVTMESWLGACGTLGEVGSELSIFRGIRWRLDSGNSRQCQLIRRGRGTRGSRRYARPASCLGDSRLAHTGTMEIHATNLKVTQHHITKVCTDLEQIEHGWLAWEKGSQEKPIHTISLAPF